MNIPTQRRKDAKFKTHRPWGTPSVGDRRRPKGQMNGFQHPHPPSVAFRRLPERINHQGTKIRLLCWHPWGRPQATLLR
jgi:hypothetical protein